MDARSSIIEWSRKSHLQGAGGRSDRRARTGRGASLLASTVLAVTLAAPQTATAAGSVEIAANGDFVSWTALGDVGRVHSLYLRHRRVDPAPATAWSYQHAHGTTGGTSFWPPHGVGHYEVEVCEWNAQERVLTTCSNTAEVEVAVNGWGQAAAVPSPDPADEVGTLAVSIDGCELAWETTGTLGAATGFMVLTERDHEPVYGEATARHAGPEQRSRSMADLPTEGRQHARVCAYDFHRNQVGTCSETLVFDFAWRFGPTCTLVSPQTSAAPQPPYSDAVAEGLAAWRTPDANGNSCASCHAPDGIDLAFPAYTRDDILRRATQHVDEAAAVAIADMIEGVREHYGWVPTIDPREYRPFQPGGQPLPGATAMERDAAFAAQLEGLELFVVVGDVDDLETAELARDELLALDPWSLPVGIPFDRFSEDAAFGSAHDAINEWVPSVGHVALATDPETWVELQDLYLGDPSDERLYDLLAALTGPDRSTHLNYDDLRGEIDAFESARFRSLLLLGHEQRRLMAGGDPHGAASVLPYQTAVVWHTGRRAYDTWACNPIHGGDPQTCMQLPGVELDGSYFAQMEALSLGWHYAGFLLDQPLVDLPGEPSLLAGHYLSSQLKHGGYPTHNAFVRAMRAVRKYWGPDQSWRGRLYYSTPQIPTTSASWDLVFMDHFMAQGGQGGHELLYGPPAGEHRDRHVRFTANVYEMLLLLLEDEVARTGQVYGRDVLVEMLRAEADARWYGPVDFLPVLVAHEPERADELAEWLDDLADLVEQAEEVSLYPVDP